MAMITFNDEIEVLDKGINLDEADSFGACCWALFAVVIIGI